MVNLSGREGEFYFGCWTNCSRDLRDQMIYRPFFHLYYLYYYRLDYSASVAEAPFFVAAVASVSAADAGFESQVHYGVLIVIPVASDLSVDMS